MSFDLVSGVPKVRNALSSITICDYLSHVATSLRSAALCCSGDEDVPQKMHVNEMLAVIEGMNQTFNMARVRSDLRAVINGLYRDSASTPIDETENIAEHATANDGTGVGVKEASGRWNGGTQGGWGDAHDRAWPKSLNHKTRTP